MCVFGGAGGEVGSSCSAVSADMWAAQVNCSAHSLLVWVSARLPPPPAAPTPRSCRYACASAHPSECPTPELPPAPFCVLPDMNCALLEIDLTAANTPKNHCCAQVSTCTKMTDMQGAPPTATTKWEKPRGTGRHLCKSLVYTAACEWHNLPHRCPHPTLLLTPPFFSSLHSTPARTALLCLCLFFWPGPALQINTSKLLLHLHSIAGCCCFVTTHRATILYSVQESTQNRMQTCTRAAGEERWEMQKTHTKQNTQQARATRTSDRQHTTPFHQGPCQQHTAQPVPDASKMPLPRQTCIHTQSHTEALIYYETRMSWKAAQCMNAIWPRCH